MKPQDSALVRRSGGCSRRALADALPRSPVFVTSDVKNFAQNRGSFVAHERLSAFDFLQSGCGHAGGCSQLWLRESGQHSPIAGKALPRGDEDDLLDGVAKYFHRRCEFVYLRAGMAGFPPIDGCPCNPGDPCKIRDGHLGLTHSREAGRGEASKNSSTHDRSRCLLMAINHGIRPPLDINTKIIDKGFISYYSTLREVFGRGRTRSARACVLAGSPVEGAGETAGSRRARTCATKGFLLARFHGQGSS